MKALALAFLFALVLLATSPAQAISECPRGQVSYDVAGHTFDYGGTCLPNTYCVQVESDGQQTDWWGRIGCYTADVCVSTNGGAVWLGPLHCGSYPSAGVRHIVWWGGCQCPCMGPPRQWVPLVGNTLPVPEFPEGEEPWP